MEIVISQEVYDRCVKFAEERIAGSAGLYAYRGEANKEKMVEDCIIGTLGEFGAYEYLKSKGISISEPDLTIYENKKKSFAADLLNQDLKIHVKSQSAKSHKRYGASWLLQRRDRVVQNPDSNEYFIFTKVEGLVVTIMGVCRIKDITDAELWGECKVPCYRHSKVALYLDDLNELDLAAL